MNSETIYNMPQSVVWFCLFTMLFVMYGVYTSHIKNIGHEAYIKELQRKYEYTYQEARNRAVFYTWLNLALTFIFGTSALVSMVIFLKKEILNL